jgi:hypothetical protein
LIDHSKEGPQFVEQVIGMAAEHALAIDVLFQVIALVTKAVREVVRVLGWKQAAILGVETEQDAIEHDEGVVECGCKRSVGALLVTQETYRYQRDGPEHLTAQRVANGDCLRTASIECAVEQTSPLRVGGQRRRGEQRGEVAKRLVIAGVEQRTQVHLEARALHEITLCGIESP